MMSVTWIPKGGSTHTHRINMVCRKPWVVTAKIKKEWAALMFCLNELIKADIWWAKRWNTNKLGPNKCQFLSLAFAKACRKYKTRASTIEEKKEEKKKMQGNLFYTKGVAKCCQFVMHNKLFALMEQSGETLFHIVSRFMRFHLIARVSRGPDCRLGRMSNVLLMCPFLFILLSSTFPAGFFPNPHSFPFADFNTF